MGNGESPIVPEQLRSARESVALSVGETAALLKVSEGELTAWEEGLSQPSVDQLWDLAELYCRSVDYFLHQTEPFPKQVTFRLAQRKSMNQLSLQARQVLVQFEELCRSESELERLLQEPREIRVPKMPELDPQELASLERERLGLGFGPITDLRKLLTKQGVRIFELPVPRDEFAGFSWWHVAYGPGILVHAQDLPGRRRFTLAHEYAHLLRADAPSLCGDPALDIAEDRFANTFAAIFLMPKEDLDDQIRRKGLLGTIPTEGQLGALATRYGVSVEAVGRRLMELGLLGRDALALLIGRLGARRPFYRRPKAPTWRRRLGEAYVSRALEAHSEGLISLGKLAEYLGVDLRTAATELKKARGSAA